MKEKILINKNLNENNSLFYENIDVSIGQGGSPVFGEVFRKNYPDGSAKT